MSATTTEWILEFRDKITAPMRKVTSATNTARDTVSGLNEKVSGIGSNLGGISMLKNALATVGVGAGMYQFVEMTKEGVEKVHELHAAEAQVEAGLKSTGFAAGMTFDKIEGIAKSISGNTLYSRSELLKMQSILVTFPNITQKTFGQASQIVADMATRMGQDLGSTAVQVGKALQDPILGATALRRVGVNMSKEQMANIKELIQHHKGEQAQLIILKELQNEFGGSAKAAFNADPLARYNKIIGATKMALGSAAITIQAALSPALIRVANLFKGLAQWVVNVVVWFREHRKVTTALASAIVAIASAIAAYKIVCLAQLAVQKAQVLWDGIQLISINVLGDAFLTASVKTKLFAAAQWMLNAAMEANPIGPIVAILAALVAITVAVVKQYDRWGAALTLVLGPLGLIINLVMTLKRHWDSIVQAFKGEGIIGGLKRIGIVLLDTLLYPVQQLLGLLSHIPGLGSLAAKGEDVLKNMRVKLNLVTKEEKEATRADAKKSDAKKDAAIPTPKLGVPNFDTGKEKSLGGEKSGSRIQSITQNIQLKNYFTIEKGATQHDIDTTAEKVVRAITDKLRDGVVAVTS